MGIGGSIFLIALGAILAFAVNAHISGLDINVVGYVLMLAGLVGLLITLWYWNSRRRSTVVSQSRPAVRGDGTYVDEYRETRRDDVPPPPPPGY
jgi:membrane protein implicated in regulation of membrane protease activity